MHSLINPLKQLQMRYILSSFLAVGFFVSVVSVSLLPTPAMALDTIFLVHPDLLGGKVIREHRYGGDGEKGNGLMDYSYNDQGQLVKADWFNLDKPIGLMQEYIFYSYNEQGRLVERQSYTPNGKKWSYSLYSYNNQGRLVKEQGYHYGEKGWQTLYSYNEQGRLVKRQSYYPNGEKGWYALYSYNDQGQLVKLQLYGHNGEKLVSYWLYTVEDPLAFKCRALDDIAACEELVK